MVVRHTNVFSQRGQWLFVSHQLLRQRCYRQFVEGPNLRMKLEPKNEPKMSSKVLCGHC